MSIGILITGALATFFILFPGLFAGPYVPPEMENVRQRLHTADLKPGETLIDLGEGDGRILLVAAREFGAQALGVGISPHGWPLSGLRSP